MDSITHRVGDAVPGWRRAVLGWQRAVLGTIAILIAGTALAFFAYGVGPGGWFKWYGMDLDIYTDATRRMLSGGAWYLDRQMHGTYGIEGGDILYPPTAVYLFVPWLVLPTWTFILTPIAVTAWAIRRLRPASWTWPLMALCLIWPDTTVKAIAGNPGLWAMMAVALGGLYGWPAAFVLLKPTLAPLALIGIRSRRWWLAIGLLAVLSLPLIVPLLQYPRVVLDATYDRAFYSQWDLPFVLLPFIAWLGRLKVRHASLLRLPAESRLELQPAA